MRRFLDQTPSVSLVAFGDVRSGLILDAASKANSPREVLDQIGEKAASCFARLRLDSPPNGDEAAASGTSIIHFTERESQVFARHAGTDEVICTVCEPGVRLEPMIQASLLLAQRLAGPQ